MGLYFDRALIHKYRRLLIGLHSTFTEHLYTNKIDYSLDSNFIEHFYINKEK